MSQKLFATLQDLDKKCQEYFNTFHTKQREIKAPTISPRHFRVYIGVSKHMLSTWQNTQPDYFNLIKSYEDQILAELEMFLIKMSLTKNLAWKFNPAPIIFTLRAYDRDQYIPEIQMNNPQIEQKEQFLISADNTAPNKTKLLKVIENKE